MRLGSRLEKWSKSVLGVLGARALPSPTLRDLRLRKGMSVLVLRPDRLGDLILSVPAIRELERRVGGSRFLTLVAGPRNEQAVRFFFPEARVLVFRRSLVSRIRLFLQLVRGRFDLAVDLHSFPFSATSAFMTLLSRSPARCGFWDRGADREWSLKVFNLGVEGPVPHLHESEKSFLLLRPLGIRKKPGAFPLPPLPRPVEGRVQRFLGSLGQGKRRFRLGIHPTLQKEDNRWSPGHYRELIDLLSACRDLDILLFHGKGEGDNLRAFQASLGWRKNVFALPEDDLFFILGAARRTDLLVLNDSGLMHWGSLVAPVLALFGPSDPRQWGPLPVGKNRPKVLRKKDRLCDSIGPSEVAAEIKKRMASRQR